MRVVALAASFALLVGCGAGDSTRAERPAQSVADPVGVTPQINACPLFEASLVLPQAIPFDSAAVIAVRAADPDADDLDLSYSWTATSGRFSEADNAVTEYRCDELGDQALTVTARDAAKCDVDLHIDVTCLSE
ncbi:MAG TPA: hypothetical protein VEQ58_01610 [Polyangiaceae bacterium]|nr:hypothetical protein [Polyangiaceae bacterium]